MELQKERLCELCGKDISHKIKSARYCCRQHKEKHYRHLNRDKYKKLKNEWNKKNREKVTRLDKERRHKEMQQYGYSKRYLRTYAKRHIDKLKEIKEEKCFKCGSRSFLDIHHKKYTKKPEDWEFICHKCHMKLHNPTTLL